MAVKKFHSVYKFQMMYDDLFRPTGRYNNNFNDRKENFGNEFHIYRLFDEQYISLVVVSYEIYHSEKCVSIVIMKVDFRKYHMLTGALTR